MLARLKSIGWLGLVVIPLVALPTSRAWAADDKDKDDSADEDDAEAGNTPDPDQPKVTAGALFVRATYPSNEVERPLNLTGGMIEGRVDVLTNISSGTAFKTFDLRLAARYGVFDTL